MIGAPMLPAKSHRRLWGVGAGFLEATAQVKRSLDYAKHKFGIVSVGNEFGIALLTLSIPVFFIDLSDLIVCRLAIFANHE
jgi:hypothetical protein